MEEGISSEEFSERLPRMTKAWLEKLGIGEEVSREQDLERR
jgi:hypothetical protein